MANYTSLITQVIRDFDEIYSVLKDKGAKTSAGAALPDPVNGVTGIATSAYANIINDNLVKVSGLSVDDLSLLANGEMANNTGSKSTGTLAVNYANKTATITNLAAGYYNESSTLTVTAPDFLDANFTNFGLNKEKTAYVLTPSNSILSSVTINKGSITGSASATASAESGKAPSATVNSTLTDTGSIITPNTPTSANPYVVTLTVEPSLKGEVVATVSADNVVPGYITGDDIKLTGASYDISGISVQKATQTYYIGHGDVDLATTSSIASEVDLSGLKVGSSASDGYAVTASTKTVTLNTDVTEGYVKAGDAVLDTSKITKTSETKYIRKGSVSAKSGNPEIEITLSAPDIVAAANYEGDTYDVTASTGALTLAHTTVEGYVKAGDVADLSVASKSNTIKVAHGTARAAIASNNITAVSDYLATSGKEFTVTSTPVLSKTLTQGYIKDNDFTVQTTGTAKNQTFYIKNGTLGTISNSISITPSFTDTDSTIAKQIFKTTQPAAGTDYYTVIANSTGSVSESGWIDAQPINSAASTSYYVPKATFNFVTNSTDGNNFIQVTTGGYIPSGQIVELGNELTEADYAVVGVGIDTDEGGLVNTALKNNYYSITLEKTSTNAGYISDSKGSISAPELKIAHGSVGTTYGVESVTKGEITGNVNDGYTVALTAVSSATTTIGDGYVKGASDLTVGTEATVSGTKKSKSESFSIPLAAGSVSINSDDIKGNVAAGGVTFVKAGESSYYVTPTISSSNDNGNAQLVVTTANAGYIDASYRTTANVTLNTNNAVSRYIKQGTKLESVNGTGTVSISNNFNTNQDGAYTISLSQPTNTKIAVSGTLEEGYYKNSTETAVTGAATVTGLTGAVSVAHGSVRVTGANANIALGSTGIEIHGETAGLAGYYELTVGAESLDLTKTITEGYIKGGDWSQPVTSVTNTNENKYFIEKYVNSNTEEDGSYTAVQNGMGAASTDDNNVEDWVQNNVAVDLDSDKIVIATKDKYVDEDITVSLHADAAGKNVRSELYRLQQRLAGNNTTLIKLA